jgi:hypothetical protein
MAIELEVDEPQTPASAIALTVGLPVVVFLVADAVLHLRGRSLMNAWPIAVTVALVLGAAALTPWIGVTVAVLAMGLAVCGLVAMLIVLLARPDRAVS